jgi:hypothetical protein
MDEVVCSSLAGFCPGLLEWWHFSMKFEQIISIISWSKLTLFRLSGGFFFGVANRPGHH